VFAALATWLQERKCPVFVAATANGLADLPPEMIRKGRWDEVFFVDLPGRREREEIFAIHLRAARIDPTEAPVGLLAQASAGFSGADIEQAVSEARLEAFCDHRPLVPGDLLEAIRLQAPQARTRMVSVGELREWARSAARPASPGLMEDEESPTRNGYVRAL
jgi:SpoVK/Ycf46/Vps4 family AAA+-type ATPase